MSTALKRHGELLRSVAEATFLEIDATSDCDGWDAAVFDLRVPVDDAGAMSMTRVRVSDRVSRLNVKATEDYVFPLLEVRKTLPGNLWFGLYVVVRKNGKVDVRYDYDRECLWRILDDKRFFDDE